MLKRISVNHLTIGMHVKEFCGSWMDHPFWRTGFVLLDPKDLLAIRASRIEEVWIDCAKGLDVSAEQSVALKAESTPQEAVGLKIAADSSHDSAPVSASDEMARAAKIVRQSRQAVLSMFEEARMGKAVDVGGAKLLVEEISDAVSRNAWALISLVRIKTADNYTYMHSVAVCAMMVSLAKQLGLDENEVRSAGLAGLLHDLGKAVVPLEVLNKPGKLTEDEFAVIRCHPVEGHKLLLVGLDMDTIVLDVCLHHHEKTDGSGYPDGLKGAEISLFAKMGAICDVYDAITSNRPYKAGWDPSESLRRMAEWANGHFDPSIFQAFVKSMGIYPVGSLVQLSSGRIGVVVEQTFKSLTKPLVKVFFSTKSNLRILPLVLDLSREDNKEKIISREDPAKWHFPDLNELWSGLPSAQW